MLINNRLGEALFYIKIVSKIDKPVLLIEYYANLPPDLKLTCGQYFKNYKTFLNLLYVVICIFL
ncbi:hypothetical protein Flavo103_41700 [Flavobacterium collinsii]|uniref:Uncharacterized protein n=1 Tax=Flavobacterium collinsii TaxID=1114861 RepID=A0ABM8KLG0_9FLAO|nr:hypothetical protein Flavo103_41700 [Flavobacterium collinsii]CAA9200441.1 hypothetical protein FLACOL7796_03252 [Flavobacterium collinsii]